MHYFSYIAKQSFKTASDGRRLFYRGGPWSRPYLIPDAATEGRLFKKRMWTMRSLLGGMIVGQPLLFLFVPDVLSKPLWLLGYVAIMLIVFRIVENIVFRSELAKLSRAESRLPAREFYSGVAAQHSTGKLVLLILCAGTFVAVGSWMVASGRDVFAGWFGIVFFGFCGVAGLYALSLKLKDQRSRPDCGE